MPTRISTAARNDAAEAIVALLDAGAGPGYIEVRTGAQPAGPNTAASGTLLATMTLSDPSFGAATTGTVTANAITDDENTADAGTASWFRAYDSNAVAVIDGSVSLTGGGGDMELDVIEVDVGGTMSVTSWTITMPGG